MAHGYQDDQHMKVIRLSALRIRRKWEGELKPILEGYEGKVWTVLSRLRISGDLL